MSTVAQDWPSRLSRGLFCLLMVLAWSGATRPRAARAQPAGAPAEQPATQPSAAQAKALAERIEKELAAVEAARAALPREEFDPAAVVASVGKDPAALLAFVCEKTWWAPYQGALRGATGVLMDRLGSSLDRALLLAELLRAAGAEARLAHGRIGPDRLAEARAAIKPIPDNWLSGGNDKAPEAMRGEVAALAKQFGLDSAELAASADEQHRTWLDKAGSINKRASEQTRMLSAAVKLGPASRPSDDAALADHWWAQWNDKGKWVDLDPLAKEAGRSIVPAEATCGFDKEGQPVLPAGSWHEVEVRVVIEKWEAGTLKELRPLAQTLRPAQCLGQRVELIQYPLNWPREDKPLDDAAMGFRASALAQTEWVPVLMVGEQAIADRSFTDTGELRATRNEGGGNVAGGLGGALGAGGGAVGDGAAKPDAKLSAEWIEYEFRVPGRATQTMRREIFDLVGPADRAAGRAPKPLLTEGSRFGRGVMLMGRTEMLLTPCWLSEAFVADIGAKAALANKAVLLELCKGDGGLRPEALVKAIDRLQPLPSQLYALAAARTALGGPKRGLYMDRPNLLTWHSYAEVQGQKIALCQGFDVVCGELASIRGTTDASAALAQGVLDANAEAALASACGRVENTAELYGGADPWVTLGGKDDPAMGSLDLPDDTKARIVADLTAGYAVVAPKKPVSIDGRERVAWWRVDLRTGQTLGMGGRGWGEGEYEWLIGADAIQQYKAWGLFACRLAVKFLQVALCGAALIQGKMAGMQTAVLAALCLMYGLFSGGGIWLGGAGTAAKSSAVWSLIGDIISCIAAYIKLFK